MDKIKKKAVFPEIFLPHDWAISASSIQSIFPGVIICSWIFCAKACKPKSTKAQLALEYPISDLEYALNCSFILQNRA